MKGTKIVFAALLSAVCIMAVSCDTTGGADTTMLGKWRYAEWTLSGEAVNLAEFGNPVITFSPDSTFLVQTGNQKNQEKWYINSDTLTMLYSDGNKQLYKLTQPSADSARLKSLNGAWNSDLLLVRIKE